MSSSCAKTPTRACARRSTKFAWFFISSPRYCSLRCRRYQPPHCHNLRPCPDSQFQPFAFALTAPFVNCWRERVDRWTTGPRLQQNAELSADGIGCALLFSLCFQNFVDGMGVALLWYSAGRLDKGWAAVMRDNEKQCRRSPCGCDAVQAVGECSGKLDCAITFDACAVGSGNGDEKRNWVLRVRAIPAERKVDCAGTAR